MSFWSRVEKALNDNEISEAELSRRIGYSQAGINGWKSKGSIPRADIALKTAKVLNTSIEYLITGNNSFKSTASNNFLIPVLNQELSAGKGDLLPEEDIVKGFIEIPKFLIHEYGNNLAAMYVHGDSMEPTLHSGDIVVATSLGWESSDGLYAIRLNGLGYVKRLQVGVNEIIIQSDNPRYKTMKEPCESDSFQVIGKIIFIGSICKN